jgi:hypothetical protein
MHGGEMHGGMNEGEMYGGKISEDKKASLGFLMIVKHLLYLSVNNKSGLWWPGSQKS